MDEWTRRRIDKIAAQTLREAGIFSPPVEVEVLLVHLKVHREFYDLAQLYRLRIGESGKSR